MAAGAWHYGQAELHLQRATGDPTGSVEEAYNLQAGAVHAQLALVAATIDSQRASPMPAAWGVILRAGEVTEVD